MPTAKMFRGRQSVKDWWTTSMQSLRLGVKIGRGPYRTLEKIKGWETKTMIRSIPFERQTEETWVGYNTRRAMRPGRYGYRLRFPFLHEKIAESIGEPWDGLCDGKVNTVTNSLKKVYKWRSTTWWQSLQTRVMEEDPDNRTRWKHKW